MLCPDCLSDPLGWTCDRACDRPECGPCDYDRYVAALRPGTWEMAAYLREQALIASERAQTAEAGEWDDWRLYVADAEAAWREAAEAEDEARRRQP